MARTARAVRPALSEESADKLAAALICLVGKWKRRDDPTYAPFYYDECWAWFQRLSADQQDTVLTLADVVGSAHKGQPRVWLRHCRRRRGVRYDRTTATYGPQLWRW